MKTGKFGLLVGSLCLILIVVAGLAGACSQKTTAPATTAAPAPAPSTTAPVPAPSTTAPVPAPSNTASAPANVIKIVANCPNPPTATPGKLMQEFANRVEAASNGRVKFTLYFSSSLFAPTEVIRSVLSGTADMQFSQVPQAEPALQVLNGYMTLPELGFPDTKTGTAIQRELFATVPDLLKEFQGLKVLFPTVWSTDAWVMTAKKPVKTAADLKGMKIQADAYTAKWVDAIGGTSVYIPFADRFTSFEKGVVDGTISYFGPISALGAVDLFNNFVYLPRLMTGYDTLVMNPDSWNRLPPDIQKIFNDQDAPYTQARQDYESQTNQVNLQKIQGKGITILSFSPEDMKYFEEAAKPIHQAWIKDATAKGKPAQALYDKLQELKAKYSK
jgi:TRAP-type C4-dicarboxylate transport system substrate-binding protein